MACCFRCTQYIVALALLLSFGLFVTSGAVDYWWVTKLAGMESSKGLWKKCTSFSNGNICNRRDNILKFEERSDTFRIKEGSDQNLDIIIVTIGVGAVCAFISLIFVGITMCQRYPSKMTVLVELFILFFGVCGGVFGLVWALIKIDSKNQGWAFYCLYGADALLLFAFGFSIILLCLRAPGAYRHTNKDDEIAMLAR